MKEVPRVFPFVGIIMPAVFGTLTKELVGKAANYLVKERVWSSRALPSTMREWSATTAQTGRHEVVVNCCCCESGQDSRLIGARFFASSRAGPHEPRCGLESRGLLVDPHALRVHTHGLWSWAVDACSSQSWSAKCSWTDSKRGKKITQRRRALVLWNSGRQITVEW